MAKALNRFTKEDPTFRTYVDPESNQTIIQGMGELHLEVYIERMRREYKPRSSPTSRRSPIVKPSASVLISTTLIRSRPVDQVSMLVSQDISNLSPRVKMHLTTSSSTASRVVSSPTEYIPSCDKGFQAALKKGTQLGFPIVGVRAAINDGAYHPVDSSDQAFQTAALQAFRETYEKAKPVILEPIMKVSVEGPTEFQGNIFGSINQRRGIIISSTEDGANCAVDAEVPLSEMFGYSTVLRSLTQGKAEYNHGTREIFQGSAERQRRT